MSKIPTSQAFCIEHNSLKCMQMQQPSAILPTRLLQPSLCTPYLSPSFICKIISRRLSPTGTLLRIRAIRMRGVSMSNQSSQADAIGYTQFTRIVTNELEQLINTVIFFFFRTNRLSVGFNEKWMFSECGWYV